MLDVATILMLGQPGHKASRMRLADTNLRLVPKCPRCHALILGSACQVVREQKKGHLTLECALWCGQCEQFTAVEVSNRKGSGRVTVKGALFERENPALLVRRGLMGRLAHMNWQIRSHLD